MDWPGSSPEGRVQSPDAGELWDFSFLGVLPQACRIVPSAAGGMDESLNLSRKGGDPSLICAEGVSKSRKEFYPEGGGF